MKLLGEFIVHEVLRLNIQEEGSSFHFIQNFGFKKVFYFALQKKFSKEEKTKQTKKPHCVCLLILQTPRAAALLLKANTWWLKKNLTNNCLNKTKQKGHKDKPIQPDRGTLTLWGAAFPALASDPKLNDFFPGQRLWYSSLIHLPLGPKELGRGTAWLRHQVSSLSARETRALVRRVRWQHKKAGEASKDWHAAGKDPEQQALPFPSASLPRPWPQGGLLWSAGQGWT